MKGRSIAGQYRKDQAGHEAGRPHSTAAGSESAGIFAVQYTPGRFAMTPRRVVVGLDIE